MKPLSLQKVPCLAGPKVTPLQCKRAIASAEFHTWAAELDPRFKVKEVKFQSVDLNKKKTRVMFIKFIADVVDEKGKFIPGIVFMRGGSVAILPVLVCRGKPYVLLAVQPRLPTGKFEFTEVPAGMLDDQEVVGAALNEIEQETGFRVKKKDLLDLSKRARHGRGSYTSPGGCAEFMRYYSFVKKVTPAQLKKLQGKCTGVLEEGEQIKLDVRPLDYCAQVPDDKTIVAWSLFNRFYRKDLSKLANNPANKLAA